MWNIDELLFDANVKTGVLRNIMLIVILTGTRVDKFRSLFEYTCKQTVYSHLHFSH